MIEETRTPLLKADLVLDRSWMTDVVYSRVQGRTPALGRADLYRCGLLAAQNCALYINMNYADTGKNPVSSMYNDLRNHWSIPQAVKIEINEQPEEDEVSDILAQYRKNSAAMVECPDRHLGSWAPCPILLNGFYHDLVGDLLFCCGVPPCDVHISDNGDNFRLFHDEMMDYFKPKLYSELAALKLCPENFEEKVLSFSAALREAGYHPQEGGLERINLD